MWRVSGPLLLIAVGLGCATAKPYQTTFNNPLLESREAAFVNQHDVGFQIQPITRENARNFPISMPITWAEADPSRSNAQMGGMGAKSMEQIGVTRRSDLYLVPIPSFEVRIANHSKDPVSFSNARFELSDSKGRTYSVITNALDLQYEVEGEMRTLGRSISSDRNVMQAVQENIRNVPLLNNNLEIPRGGTWAGFLAFKIQAYGPDEYYPLMRSIENFTVKVSNVEAGGGPIQFSLPFDKKTKAIQVTCPAEVKEPTLERCQGPQT